MDVKPWEPVRGGWAGFDRWVWVGHKHNHFCLNASDLHITLANGQRIIVRALSEDRKAARAAGRMVR